MWGSGGGDTDLTMGLCTGPQDLRRRGSDSDCFNLRQRQQHQDQTARRDSELFAWHEARRRSSGYVSDGSSSSVSPGVSSSQETRHAAPGMEYVPAWLKHLRLHKYTEHIMGLTYQELVELTEEKLQNMNVTQGARKKLLLNIERLSERPQALAAIETTLENDDCDIKNVLADLESVIRSPIFIEDTAESEASQESATDSGAEVSDDEETTGELSDKQQVSGQQLVQMIMKTLKKTTSVFLLSEHMDGKLCE